MLSGMPRAPWAGSHLAACRCWRGAASPPMPRTATRLCCWRSDDPVDDTACWSDDPVPVSGREDRLRPDEQVDGRDLFGERRGLQVAAEA